MVNTTEMTLVVLDANPDGILLTRRQMRHDGIVNNVVWQRKPEHLLATLRGLRSLGIGAAELMILLDVNMPRSDGFETLKKLRASEDFKDVPVIMLSASDDESDMFESFDLGASGYIVKPFQADEFFAALTNLPQVKYQLVR